MPDQRTRRSIWKKPEGGKPAMADTAKQRVLDVVQRLPDDATFDDAIERILFLAKIEKGREQADRGETSAHDDVKRRSGAS